MHREPVAAHSSGVPETAAKRVNVLRSRGMEPLLAARPRFTSEGSPWTGITVERHTVASVEVPQHEHGSMCMHLQLSGRVGLEWWCGGAHGVERTDPGALILLPSGTSDRMVWEGTSERLIISVDQAVLDRAAVGAGLSAAPSFRRQWLLYDPALRALLAEMGRETERGWPAGPLFGDMLGLSLAHTLLQRHGGVPIRPQSLLGGLPLHRLRRVLELIEANLDATLTLKQMADEAGLSAFHFARLFRASTGVTPYQYVLDQKIAAAKRLLKRGNITIAEAAFSTGFSSDVNFVRAFRQRVGVTPAVWSRSS
jgi:AraC family transcriptional regulator